MATNSLEIRQEGSPSEVESLVWKHQHSLHEGRGLANEDYKRQGPFLVMDP